MNSVFVKLTGPDKRPIYVAITQIASVSPVKFAPDVPAPRHPFSILHCRARVQTSAEEGGIFVLETPHQVVTAVDVASGLRAMRRRYGAAVRAGRRRKARKGGAR